MATLASSGMTPEQFAALVRNTVDMTRRMNGASSLAELAKADADAGIRLYYVGDGPKAGCIGFDKRAANKSGSKETLTCFRQGTPPEQFDVTVPLGSIQPLFPTMQEQAQGRVFTDAERRAHFASAQAAYLERHIESQLQDFDAKVDEIAGSLRDAADRIVRNYANRVSQLDEDGKPGYDPFDLATWVINQINWIQPNLHPENLVRVARAISDARRQLAELKADA